MLNPAQTEIPKDVIFGTTITVDITNANTASTGIKYQEFTNQAFPNTLDGKSLYGAIGVGGDYTLTFIGIAGRSAMYFYVGYTGTGKKIYLTPFYK